MVRRFEIVHGDKTTSGGTVLAGDTPDSIGGLAPAYEGDLVRCSACKTMGYIACDGLRHSMTGPDGREAALSDDLCICKCERPPRLIASQETSFIDI